MGSGHGKGEQAHKARRTRPLQADTAGGQSDRHRPRRNNSQQLAGLAAKQQPQTTLAGLSPCSAGWWRECGGAGHSEGGLRPTLPVCLPPTYRLCLSLSIPTPLICETQFSPNLFSCFYFPFYFPTQNSSPNPLYRLCLDNLSCPYPTPNPYVPFPEGNKGGLASRAEAQQSLRMASS